MPQNVEIDLIFPVRLVSILLAGSRPPCSPSPDDEMSISPARTPSLGRGALWRVDRLRADYVHDACERIEGIVKTSTPSSCTSRIVRSTIVYLRGDNTVDTTPPGGEGSFSHLWESHEPGLHMRHPQCVEDVLYVSRVCRAVSKFSTYDEVLNVLKQPKQTRGNISSQDILNSNELVRTHRYKCSTSYV